MTRAPRFWRPPSRRLRGGSPIRFERPVLGAARGKVLACLGASNAINLCFLAFDERMWNPELFSGSALIAGATAYVVAIPLVLRKVPAGFSLSVTAALLASIVVVGDNFSIFGSTPNLATYWLNWAFFVVQVPLVWWSLAALWRAAASASLPTPGPGLPGSAANEGSNRGP